MTSLTQRFRQKTSWCLIFCMVFQTLISPTQVLALTNGPKQPEFDSFTPVSTSNMVNTFTGGFNYNLPVLNIPGADGGGYAMSLSYDANPNVESQASWVGAGWTLNPGALDRSKRGIPDDWKQKTIKEYNKNRPNFTIGVTNSIGLELASNDQAAGVSLSIGSTNIFNNYTGFRQSTNIGASGNVSSGSLGAGVNLGINITGRDVTFNAGASFSLKLGKSKEDKGKEDKGKDNKSTKKFAELTKVEKAEATKNSYKNATTKFSTGGSYSTSSHLATALAPIITPYRGFSFNIGLQARIGVTTVGVRPGFNASFDIKGNIPYMEHSAFGYMYNQNREQHKDYNYNPLNGAVQDYLGIINNIPRPIMSDYYIEKSAPYSVRDNVVGIPFNNADDFTVTGEGVAGSFRLNHNRVGHFYPNIARSENAILQIGLDLNIITGPFGAGGGASIGSGFQRTSSFKWLGKFYGDKFYGDPGDPDVFTDLYEFDTDNQKPFFRFAGDLGGKLKYGDFETATATLEGSGPEIPGAKFFKPNVDPANASGNIDVDRNQGDAYTKQSSSIEYLLNAQIATDNDFNATAFDKNSLIKEQTKWSREADGTNGTEKLQDGIAQVRVTNPDGVRYVYGLPSYVMNERNMSYGVKGTSPVLEHNNLVYQDVVASGGPSSSDILKNKTVIGQELDGSYTSTYLMTQINTYDYIDRTGNGATVDDFGGYTKFDYRKWLDNDLANDGTATDNLYCFRSPYTGLSYAKNKIADGRDDLGSVSEGHKELYHLKAVETKSHIAIFITNKTVGTTDFLEYGINDAIYNGSGEKRLDGLGANRELITVNGEDYSKAAKDPTAKGIGQELERLERIVLFSKDDLEKPLVCTNFEYDYSIWPNLPNHEMGNYPNSNTDPNRNNGKLTLKKVWFEYEGVRSYKISPYEFGYEYKPASTIKKEVKDRYPDLFNDWPNYAIGAQCPDYSPHTLDSWGHHQYKGEEQSEQLRPWVWQGVQNNTKYDPAAWQLKQVKLPSGGDILIQYEQKNYQKVQDRDPLAMVSLLSPKSFDDDNLTSSANKYFLNLEEMGIASGDMTTKNALVTSIEDRYLNNSDERIYFKFLYDLTGNNANLESSTSEYISGYSVVEAVGIDGDGDVFITLGRSTTSTGSALSVAELDALPRKLCYDYIVYQYNFGALSTVNMVDFEENELDAADEEADESNQKSLAFDMVEKIIPEMLEDLGTTALTVGNLAQIGGTCKDFNEELSYIRVPMVTPKKGGGIRVKRIMLYDEGLETGAAELYGTEYSYENLDGTSSGVASNEPASAREESALVDYEARDVQTLANRLFAGKDRKELEAPFGESLLPLPSVGHSRVIVQNIYKGETNSGFTEHTFFTCEDYPYDRMYQIGDVTGQRGVDYTKISGKKNNLHKQRDLLTLPLGFLNYNRDNVWVTQGWRFIKNDMNGKPKAVRSYGGVYDLANLLDYNSDGIKDLPPSSLETVHEYYEPGEKANVMRFENGKYKVEEEHLGMEMDVTMTMQTIKDESMDFSFEFDIGGMYVPSIEFTFSPSFSYSQKAYSSHLTSKVISFPSVAKSVTTTKNGTTTRTEYLAFSNLTGQPVLTRVTDGYHDLYVPDGSTTSAQYDGSIYNWSIPAAWFYEALQRPDDNVGVKGFNMLSATVGSVTSYGADGNILDNLNGQELTWTDNPEGVLSASAMTYNTGWLSASGTNVEESYGIDGSNPSDPDYVALKDQLDAIPRPHNTYIFEGTITKDDISNPVNRSYEKGTIENFEFFDWIGAFQGTSGWRWVSGVDKYSPNGYALEETNPLEIPSTAKYGYHKFLSTLVAQNAEYETVFFESFEDETAPSNATSNKAHAGIKSLEIASNTNYSVQSLVATDKLKDSDRGGVQIKLWAYQPAIGVVDYSADMEVDLNGLIKNPEIVAQVGDWVLLSTEFMPVELPSIGGAITINFNNKHTSEIYLDDIRIQPRYGEMMTYVYNPKDFKVLATFDDEHFGVYYQYNEEGQLTRKYIETERGVKLLQESQYNSHTVPRD
jgi:hypothetical protein